MSLATGNTWSHKDIKLVGFSLAGISTSIAYPAADVCFDVAQGLPFQVPITNILITHGHLDHASGLPYLLGQKAMHGTAPPNVYLPHALHGPMTRILKLWSEIEEHTYDYRLEAVGEGDERPLKGRHFFRTFPTFHRIPSQGYTVFEHKKRLLEPYRGVSHVELGALRRKGIEIEEKYAEPQVSFTGDSRIEFLESAQVQESRVLVMETTYWDERKTIANAREWGHIHFDELLPWLDRIKCEKIVLIHSSARYKAEDLLAILDRRIPDKHRGRVELFPR